MSLRDAAARDEALLAALAAADLAEPQRVLGPHASRDGLLVRAFHPQASGAECLLADGRAVACRKAAVAGVFEAQLPGLTSTAPGHRLRFHFANGESCEEHDPYRFPSSLGELDLYLFAEGTHRRLWQLLGAHACTLEAVAGVRFAVWAPHARRVSVVGDFCAWNGLRLPMRRCGATGVFELFVPGLAEGALYKFEIKTRSGAIRLKTDPFAFAMERPPQTASLVSVARHHWGDDAWLEARRSANPLREPISIYELHLGSWRRGIGSYRELAAPLIQHMQRFGFTHVELLPVTEHPFDGSWGYQVSGYFAPTSRYGSPDDLRALIDALHQAGIGVILDWVPAHFPRDDFALRRFDGEALYEYADPRLGEHPDWGTLVFDFARNQVRNFLLASALYWIDAFHIDGLRVDAVASMLYRDYSRAEGEWIPNVHGGRENLEAVRFLRELNLAIHEEHPGVVTIAAVYEHSEHFIMPLSHDEVVHGKRSLLEKMPGDAWRKRANLRLLFGYQFTRPGKKLLFMGSELASSREWSHEEHLDWDLADDAERGGIGRWLEALGRLYHAHPCLWRGDPDPEAFSWIDCSDSTNSIVSYRRRSGEDELVIVLNLTPEPQPHYRIGAPRAGEWELVQNGDDPHFGGSGYALPQRYRSEPLACHAHAQSLALMLPPLACLVLAPSGMRS